MQANPSALDCFETDTLVIGAGVIGLAVARALAPVVPELMVLEAEALIGSGISSRNSEVIHAGIYYPANSLKARWCVQGREQLYRYCAEHHVPHRRCGKLIVATNDAQQAELKGIQAKASQNGVADLCWISRRELQQMEPALNVVAALHSPSTGIIDSHALMLQLQADAEQYGAQVVLNSPILMGRVIESGFELEVGGDSPCRIRCRRLINAAGLNAVALLHKLAGFPAHCVPPFYLARGNYYALSVTSPFSRLIYPIPEPGGLGVHLTLDMAGQARFGPDVEWIDQVDYQVNPARLGHFYQEIRRYWPALPDDALQPAYCGIRPKLSGPGQANADFVLQTETQHGIAGLVNLLGIESPGLTSCLAIADAVRQALKL